MQEGTCPRGYYEHKQIGICAHLNNATCNLERSKDCHSASCQAHFEHRNNGVKGEEFISISVSTSRGFDETDRNGAIG